MISSKKYLVLLSLFAILLILPAQADSTITASPTTQTIYSGTTISIDFSITVQSWKIVINWGDGSTSNLNCPGPQPCWVFPTAQHIYTLPDGWTHLVYGGTGQACDVNGMNCSSVSFTVSVFSVPIWGGSGGGNRPRPI